MSKGGSTRYFPFRCLYLSPLTCVSGIKDWEDKEVWKTIEMGQWWHKRERKRVRSESYLRLCKELEGIVSTLIWLYHLVKTNSRTLIVFFPSLFNLTLHVAGCPTPTRDVGGRVMGSGPRGSYWRGYDDVDEKRRYSVLGDKESLRELLSVYGSQVQTFSTGFSFYTERADVRWRFRSERQVL